MEELVGALRSVLNSAEGGLTIHELERDYIRLNGRGVPLKQHGFARLIDFLASNKDDFKLSDRNGELTAHVVASPDKQQKGVIESQIYSRTARSRSQSPATPLRQPNAASVQNIPRESRAKKPTIPESPRSPECQDSPRGRGQSDSGGRMNRFLSNSSAPIRDERIVVTMEDDSRTSRIMPPLRRGRGLMAAVVNLPTRVPESLERNEHNGQSSGNPLEMNNRRNEYLSNSSGAKDGVKDSSNNVNHSAGNETSKISTVKEKIPNRKVSFDSEVTAFHLPELPCDEYEPECAFDPPAFDCTSGVGLFNPGFVAQPNGVGSPCTSPVPPLVKPGVVDHSLSWIIESNGEHDGRQYLVIPLRNKDSIERDSKAESIKTVPQTIASKKEKLQSLKSMLNLSASDYKTLSVPTSEGVQFLSSITVDGKKYTSAPYYAKSVAEAEDAVTAKVIEALTNSIAKKSYSEVKDMSAMCNDVVALVLKYKPDGVYHDKLENEYIEQFGQKLPENWLAIMVADCSAKVHVEKMFDGRYILTESKPKSAPKTGSSRSSSVASSLSTADASENDNGRFSPQDCTPARINERPGSPSEAIGTVQLPSVNSDVPVYIENAVSFSKVSVRIIGDEYSKKLEDLSTEMDMFYMNDTRKLVRDEILPGRAYAARLHDEWHRVVVVSVEDDRVECSFKDTLEVDNVKMADIRLLDPKFCSLPYQGIACKLYGLTDPVLDSNPFVSSSMYKLIMRKTFMARIITKDEKSITVILYDTSTANDVNMNEGLVNTMLYESVNCADPYLGSGQLLGKSIVQAVVSYVLADEPSVYLQTDKTGIALIETKLNMIAAELQDCEGVLNVQLNKCYLAKIDDAWYRVVTLEFRDEKLLSVLLVDYGSKFRIDESQLRRIPSHTLEVYRYQAVKYRLFSVPPDDRSLWTVRCAQKLLDLLPRDQIVLVSEKAGAERGCVELFKRDEGTNELISLNAAIASQNDLFDSNVSSVPSDSNLSRRFSQISVTEEISLLPDLPELGQQFDIHITLAAQPSNFAFQLWRGGEKLDRLMIALNAYYNSLDSNCTKNDGGLLKLGDFCAHKHEDGVWYRCQIKQDLGCGVVSLSFVDYGDLIFCQNLKILRFLKPEFQCLRRQAFKGRLADIEPIRKDWMPEDTLFFKDIVKERQFKATMLGRERVQGMDDDFISVRLVDASLSPNFYPHLLLVNQNRALLREIREQ